MKQVKGRLGFAVLVASMVVVGLAVAGSSPVAAQTDSAAAARCSAFHRFGSEPVAVAKTADLSKVLATVEWGFSSDHGFCYLILDDAALDVLRGDLSSIPARTPSTSDGAAAARCSAFHRFGSEPVAVAKTADLSKVLATVEWGFSSDHGFCYLILDDAALGLLRNAEDASIPTQDPIGAPDIVAALSVTAGVESLVVSWSAAVENGSPVTGYGVRYRVRDADATLAGDQPGGWVAHPHSGTVTAATIAGLVVGTAYEVQVQAISAAGNSGWPSPSTGTPFGIPDAPGAPSVVAGDGGLTVSWSAPSGNGSPIAGYEVQYSVTGIGSWVDWPYLAKDTTVNIHGLERSTRYGVRVRATTNVNSGQWSETGFGTTFSKGEYTIHVFYCAPAGVYTDSDLRSESDRLTQLIGGFFSRESSGEVELVFAPGGFVSPSIDWHNSTIDDHADGDPCSPEVFELGDYQYPLILWHVPPGPDSSGFAGTSNGKRLAVVPTLESYGNSNWHALTIAHEMGHMLFGLDHSSPYPSIMAHTARFPLDENRLGCDELQVLGWAVHDRCQLGYLQTPDGQFIELAINKYHSCGIRLDKSVQCWGSNYIEPLTAPKGEFETVAVGVFHSCGLREDGSIKCWGRNQHQQLDAPAGKFISIAAGDFSTCGIRSEDTIECWGSGQHLATDLPNGSFSSLSVGHDHACGLHPSGTLQCWGSNHRGQASAPAGTFKAVAAGGHHSCGVLTNGSIECWGEDENGHGGLVWKPKELSRHSLVAIDAGISHTCGLNDVGTVICWGSGSGAIDDVPNELFTRIYAGDNYTCGLTVYSAVRCWGGDYFGQLNVPRGAFTYIEAGRSATCGIREDGTLRCWGQGGHGIGQSRPGIYKSVSVGHIHTCGIREDDTIECWGSNDAGVVEDASEGVFVAVTSGQAYSCGLKASGAVECWGWNRYGQTSAPDGQFISVSAGESHVCGILDGGNIKCWGRESLAPQGTFIAVDVGLYFACAVHQDTRFIGCWGDNRFGQTQSTSGRYIDVGAGYYHACGLREDGTITCWGSNYDGTFGTYIGQLENVPDGKFTALTVGDYHSCGLREDGVVRCWGSEYASA